MSSQGNADYFLGVIGEPVMSDKEAWKIYQDYCSEQCKLYPSESKERIYYEGEVAKCQAELDQL